jgi:hypothetical protein
MHARQWMRTAEAESSIGASCSEGIAQLAGFRRTLPSPLAQAYLPLSLLFRSSRHVPRVESSGACRGAGPNRNAHRSCAAKQTTGTKRKKTIAEQTMKTRERRERETALQAQAERSNRIPLLQSAFRCTIALPHPSRKVCAGRKYRCEGQAPVGEQEESIVESAAAAKPQRMGCAAIALGTTSGVRLAWCRVMMARGCAFLPWC